MGTSAPRAPDDDRIAALHREATQHKDSRDWPAAVRCLYEAKALMQRSSVLYPVLSWLRLPLFLQQAGRYDEAVAEFGWLLDTTPDRIAREFGHQTPDVIKRIVRDDLATIRDKMRLASQREAARRARGGR